MCTWVIELTEEFIIIKRRAFTRFISSVKSLLNKVRSALESIKRVMIKKMIRRPVPIELKIAPFLIAVVVYYMVMLGIGFPFPSATFVAASLVIAAYTIIFGFKIASSPVAVKPKLVEISKPEPEPEPKLPEVKLSLPEAVVTRSGIKVICVRCKEKFTVRKPDLTFRLDGENVGEFSCPSCKTSFIAKLAVRTS